MDELKAFRFSNLQTIRLWPADPILMREPGVYDRIEAIVETIVRCYGWDSDRAAWERLKRLEHIRFDHYNAPREWRIGTDQAQLATLQETPFMRDKLRIVELVDGRRAWLQMKDLNRIQNTTESSWPWLDKAAEALRKMDEEEYIEDL